MRIVSYLFISTVILLTSCQKDVEPVNVVPRVNAGPAQVITVNTASLSGSASDTDGRVVAYLWSQVSGPAKAHFLNEGAAETMVDGLKNGTYLFQLMATDDKGATGVDTVSVQVKAPGIQTLTLQPANNVNEFQLAYYLTSHFSTGLAEIPVEAWTKNNDPFIVRQIIKFDLGTIPANATIISAQLYLYSHPNPVNGDRNANSGSANAFFVRQITSNWTSTSVSWTNEPTVTSANEVYVPSTTEKNLDLNLNVKGQIASMVANNAKYGFYLKLENEVTYNARIFVGSYNTIYTDKRPKLVITYQ